MEKAKLDRNDIIFEAMIKSAEIEVMQEELDALPSLDELNKLYKPSNALEEGIKGVIAKDKRIKNINRARKQFKKIAAVAAIVFAVGIATLMSVEASRVFILNIFVNLHDDHIAFEFGQNETSDIVGEIVLGFLPDGFVLVSNQVFDNFSMVIYENDEGERLIIRRGASESLSTSVDNEIREFSSIQINRQEAFLFEATGADYQNALMWSYGNDVMTIFADIDVALIIVIAENIFLR